MTVRSPNFLVVGAQKCGTSYLCAMLARHASVFHSDPKEPLFFQKPGVDRENFDAYLSTYFAAASSKPWVGEGSTVYFQWPNALENIKSYLGSGISVIVSLRHPTDRAVSFYLHNLRKGRISGNERIADVGKDVKLSPVLSSLYASHVERWLEAYGDNVLFLRFDELLESPKAFVTQATDFLGIAPMGEVNARAVNRGFGLVWKGDILTLETPLENGQTSPEFSLSELEDLHSLFQDDIARTEAVLGRRLDAWKKMPDFTERQASW